MEEAYGDGPRRTAPRRAYRLAAGGLLGGLAAAGQWDDEAKHYEGEFKAGGTIVTVDAADRYIKAADLL